MPALQLGADIMVAAALLSELAIVTADIICRACFGFSLVWSQEIAQLALTTLTFIGGAASYGRGQLLAVTAVIERLPPWSPRLAVAFDDIVILTASLVILDGSWPLLAAGWSERTPVLQIAQSWMILPVPIGMLFFVVLAATKLLSHRRADLLRALILFAAVLALAAVTRPFWSGWMQSLQGIGFVMAVFALLLLAGLPIAFVLVVSAGLYVIGSGVAGLAVVPRQMNDAVGSFILLAVPFFVFAGLLMAQGGLGRRIAALFNALIGHVRGGPLQVIIVTMYIFSGLSGSKAADMAAVGGTMKDMALARGYRRGEIAAVLAAAAVMGETIPPSIALLVLGSVTTLSILTLFVAGLVPAAVLGIALMVCATVRARRARIPAERRVPGRVLGRAAADAILPMLLPVLLVGGVLTGLATPTEVSALAVTYSLALAGLGYRELDRAAVWRAILGTTTMSGMILFIISAAAPFSWSMAIAQVPSAIADLVASAGSDRLLFMLGTIVALVIAGALLESLPALIIFAPLLLPVAGNVGVDPIQYGIVLVLSMGVGAFLPPIGVGVYVACAITGADVAEITRPLLGYLAILVLAVFLVAMVPWFSLALPAYLELQ